MIEDSKKGDMKQVQVESQLLKMCMDKFVELQEKVENAQVAKVQGKYQYFLRKFQKITEEHQKYKELYGNIEKCVEESPLILEENRSIGFINKVLQETQQKYNQLKESIESLRAEKEKNHNEMLQLKGTLLKLKGEYFELERREEELLQKRKLDLSQSKQRQNVRTMFKIRQEKKLHLRQTCKIKPVSVQVLRLDQAHLQRKIMSEFQEVNRLKEQFLERVGTNMEECLRSQLKQLGDKEQTNKLISKRKVHLNSRTNLRSLASYDPDSNTLEVFKLMKNYENELKNFMNLSEQQVIEMIVQKNRVNQVLQLIEQEKRGLIEIYQKAKRPKEK